MHAAHTNMYNFIMVWNTIYACIMQTQSIIILTVFLTFTQHFRTQVSCSANNKKLCKNELYKLGNYQKTVQRLIYTNRWLLQTCTDKIHTSTCKASKLVTQALSVSSNMVKASGPWEQNEILQQWRPPSTHTQLCSAIGESSAPGQIFFTCVNWR